MSLFVILSIYIVINSFLFFSLVKWLLKFKNLPFSTEIIVIVGIIYFICFISIILGYFLKKSPIQKRCQKLANNFMGLLIYIIMFVVISFSIKLLLIYVFKINKSLFYTNTYLIILTIIWLLTLLSIFIYGNYNYKKISTKYYQLYINKKSKVKRLRIALVADFHLGYSVGYKMMEQMANIINEHTVDLVLIAGDIFDNGYKSIDDIDKVIKSLKSINSKYGSYCVFGNHDVEEKLFSGFSTTKLKKVSRTKEMDEIISKANIKVLNDEIVKIEDFYIIGRKDSEKTGNGDSKRLSLNKLIENIDDKSFNIILEHQPRNLKKIAKYPIDLHLAGHTHNGQYFPLNIGTKLMWENDYGLKQYNNMYSIVTSGIGVYGPSIRIGTTSEVVIIDIKTKEN